MIYPDLIRYRMDESFIKRVSDFKEGDDIEFESFYTGPGTIFSSYRAKIKSSAVYLSENLEFSVWHLIMQLAELYKYSSSSGYSNTEEVDLFLRYDLKNDYWYFIRKDRYDHEFKVHYH